MSDIIQELPGWDLFFYYGESSLENESVFDLYLILLQNKRSLFYDRRESAGINEYVNTPNGINLQVFARFDIANAISYRNTLVTDGSNNTTDRRIAVSQNSIGFSAKEDTLDVNVLYFLYADYEKPKSNSFKLGR